MWAFGATAHAQGAVFQVPSREGAVTTLYWEAAPGATATVFLLPGGAGGFGRLQDGRPQGGNFLVRSVPHFLANGFNVAIFGRTSDLELGWTERTGAAHMADIAAALALVKNKSSLPVWIVGTSRGTVSATAAAIRLHDPAIAGLVLSASVVRDGTPGAVPRQDLRAITVPVLVYHHAKDACKHCPASGTIAILEGLANAPVKTRMVVDGGANPQGDVCGAQHWHGFIGMEQQAVGDIAGWIRHPASSAGAVPPPGPAARAAAPAPAPAPATPSP